MRIKCLLIILFECLAVISCIKLYGQGWVQFTPGSVLKMQGNAFLVVDNMHVVNNGTIQLSGGNGILKFTGNNNVHFSGSSITLLDKLQLAKSSASQLQLQSDLQIAGELIFNGGLLDLDNHIIDLGTSGTLTGEDELSHAFTTGAGYIQIATTLNAPSQVNPGNLGAIISTSQNPGNVMIRRGHRVQIGTGLSTSISRYFDIVPTNNTNLDATFRFIYLDAELNNLNESSLVFYKSDDQVTWQNQGFDSRSIPLNYVEKNAIPQFSRWTLSAPGTPLPVTGLVLTGSWRSGHAFLQWSTQAEYNNDYFDMERKYASESLFIPVGRQYTKNADGNSQTITVYSRTDSSATNTHGTIQYRLRQSDRNGHFVYSNIVLVRPDVASTFVERIFPNTFQGNQVFIQTGNMTLTQMQVNLYDATGKLCAGFRLPYQSQWVLMPFLPAGVYRMVITSGQLVYTGTLVKE